MGQTGSKFTGLEKSTECYVGVSGRTCSKHRVPMLNVLNVLNEKSLPQFESAQL